MSLSQYSKKRKFSKTSEPKQESIDTLEYPEEEINAEDIPF